MTSAAACARVRVGSDTVAVPADAVVRAFVTEAPLLRIPRRAGAVVGACRTAWGTVPVVDLSVWLPLQAAPEPARSLLLLRAGNRVLGVRIDAMAGVQRPRALHRVHHDDRPDELFQSVAEWQDGTLGPLLDVVRLLALTQVWCEAAGLGAEVGVASRAGQDVGEPTRPHAIVRAGSASWAIPAADLVRVVPAAPLEFAMPAGNWVRGICAWEGRKLPVVDIAAREGTGTTGGALMAVVACGDLAVAVLADAVQQLAHLPVNDAAADGLRPAPGGLDLRRLDIAALVDNLPEAGISRVDATTRGRTHVASRSAPEAHVLFEADSTYASPVGPILQVVALDATLARRLADGESCTLPFRGASIPLVALPPFSGNPSPVPTSALVVAAADGAAVAVAVGRLRGWADGTSLDPGGVRTAQLGDLKMVTLRRGGLRTSHTVVDLAEMAHVLA